MDKRTGFTLIELLVVIAIVALLMGILLPSLKKAAGNSLSHAEFLELVLQDELFIRKERQIKRRIKVATFRELKTLEGFDWQFNPSIKKKQIYGLASCRFIRECRDCLFLGPPGTGKSHLVQAIDIRSLRAASLFDIVRSSMR